MNAADSPKEGSGKFSASSPSEFLHLDHIGSHVGQHHPANRPGYSAQVRPPACHPTGRESLYLRIEVESFEKRAVAERKSSVPERAKPSARSDSDRGVESECDERTALPPGDQGRARRERSAEPGLLPLPRCQRPPASPIPFVMLPAHRKSGPPAKSPARSRRRSGQTSAAIRMCHDETESTYRDPESAGFPRKLAHRNKRQSPHPAYMRPQSPRRADRTQACDAFSDMHHPSVVPGLF